MKQPEERKPEIANFSLSQEKNFLTFLILGIFSSYDDCEKLCRGNNKQVPSYFDMVQMDKNFNHEQYVDFADKTGFNAGNPNMTMLVNNVDFYWINAKKDFQIE